MRVGWDLHGGTWGMLIYSAGLTCFLSNAGEWDCSRDHKGEGHWADDALFEHGFRRWSRCSRTSNNKVSRTAFTQARLVERQEGR